MLFEIIDTQKVSYVYVKYFKQIFKWMDPKISKFAAHPFPPSLLVCPREQWQRRQLQKMKKSIAYSFCNPSKFVLPRNDAHANRL